MLTEKQRKELLKLAPGTKFDEPLSWHTYFRIGGPTDAFLVYKNSDFQPLKNILGFCLNEKIPITIIGRGSNILIPDNGLRGLILRLDSDSITAYPPFLQNDPTVIQVLAGCSMQRLVKFTLDLGLTGLEPFLGLPGNVGSAVYNNAHFKRVQLFGNFVTKIWTIPLALKNMREEKCYKQTELQFDYDYSIFQSLPQKELIVVVEIVLKRGNKEEIKKRAEELLKQRKESQPLDLPSSGCIFKNPDCCSAGWLIDQAGMKGVKVGGAEVSGKHANFIINPEKMATAQDVLTLINLIKDAVLKKFGILLEKEIFVMNNNQEELKNE